VPTDPSFAFLSRNEVLAIHCTLLERFGGYAKKRGPAQLARTPFPACFRLLWCSASTSDDLLQIKAIVLHHLGPCRDEVIDELVMRIIGCIDFCNGTQLRV